MLHVPFVAGVLLATESAGHIGCDFCTGTLCLLLDNSATVFSEGPCPRIHLGELVPPSGLPNRTGWSHHSGELGSTNVNGMSGGARFPVP